MSAVPVRVLLVEDSPSDAGLIVKMLVDEPLNCEVTRTSTLKETLVQIDLHAFDILLLDMSLPDSAGLRTVSRINQHAVHLPIVVLTANDSEEMSVQAVHQGAQDYLTKNSLNAQVLAKSIRYCLERKRVDETLRKREAELAHLARVNTVGEMASGLAHELNQPLSAISNLSAASAREIEAGRFDVPQLANTFHEISELAVKTGDIIRHLRNLIRKSEPKRSSVSIKAVIDNATALTRRDAHALGIGIRIEVDPAIPPVWCDPIQVEQVLLNLFRNAVQAMEETSAERRTLEIRAASLPGEMVEVAVSDRGKGLSAEETAKVFAPFYSTRDAGLGMGLSISRSLVEAHAGKIWVTSVPGQGATFRFTLPTKELAP